MGKICTIEGCSKKVMGRGLCSYHYYHRNETIECSLCGRKEKSPYDGQVLVWCRHCVQWETKDTFRGKDGSTLKD